MILDLLDLIEHLQSVRFHKGNMKVVLWDIDTRSYQHLTKENIELQLDSADQVRLSIGINDFQSNHAEQPTRRPLP